METRKTRSMLPIQVHALGVHGHHSRRGISETRCAIIEKFTPPLLLLTTVDHACAVSNRNSTNTLLATLTNCDSSGSKEAESAWETRIRNAPSRIFRINSLVQASLREGVFG